MCDVIYVAFRDQLWNLCDFLKSLCVYVCTCVCVCVCGCVCVCVCVCAHMCTLLTECNDLWIQQNIFCYMINATLNLYTSPQYKYSGIYWNHFVRLSSCPCVQVRPDDISCTIQAFLTKLGMVVNYYEAECHEQKSVYNLQCQSHSEGLYTQNMITFTISSKLLVHLQPNLVW